MSDSDPTASPNPANVKNAKTLKKWTSIIENFEAEDRAWNETAAKYSAMHAKALDTYENIEDERQITAQWHDSWLEALSPIEQQFINHHCFNDEGAEALEMMYRAVENLQAKVR